MILLSSSNYSTRNGGAHGRYGIGDWSFLKCREHMINVSAICFFAFHNNDSWFTVSFLMGLVFFLYIL